MLIRSPGSGQARQPNSGLIPFKRSANMDEITLVTNGRMRRLRAPGRVLVVTAGEIGRRVMTGHHICERTGHSGGASSAWRSRTWGGEAQVHRGPDRWMIIAVAVCAL